MDKPLKESGMRGVELAAILAIGAFESTDFYVPGLLLLFQ